MKKIFTFFGLAAAMTMVSCNKEAAVQAPENAEPQTVMLTLNASRGDETKTTLAEDNVDHYLSCRWAEGDVIYVYNVASGDQIGSLEIDRTSVAVEGNGSKASFTGNVTIDNPQQQKVAFLYPGSGNKDYMDDLVQAGKFTLSLAYSSDIAGLAKYDIAYATGTLQKSGSKYTAAVTMNPIMAFGYFSTEGIDSVPSAKTYTSVILDLKTGDVTGEKLATGLTIPADAKFYLPLVIPSNGTNINITCGVKLEDGSVDDAGYKMATEVSQVLPFNANRGVYYRMSKYAESPYTAYGPVPFKKETRRYNTLCKSKFNIAKPTEDAEYVTFTEGNLQWIGSAPGDNHWQIAKNQFEVLHMGSTGWTQSSKNKTNYIAGQDLDLFGWGSMPGEYEFCSSTSNSDYSWPTDDWTSITAYVDVFSSADTYPIGSKSYKVLTNTEWVNLFQNHEFAPVTVSDKYWGSDNATGIVVIPEDVTASSITKKWKLTANQTDLSDQLDTDEKKAAFAYTANYISSSDIDGKGLLFLPAAGYRYGGGLDAFGQNGYYWSSVSASSTYAYYVSFCAGTFSAQNSNSRYYGFSVRLAVE